MNTFVFLIFTFFIHAVNADYCQDTLSLEKKKELINKSIYLVEDIECVRETLRWLISNNRHYTGKNENNIIDKRILKKSPYFVEKVKKKNGKYHWRITNRHFLKRSTSRLPASVDNLAQNPKENKHNLSLGIYLGSASVASIDTLSNTKESAVADVGMGVNIKWSHLWTPHVNFYAIGTLKKYKFRVADKRSLTASNIKQTYIGTGIDFKLNDRFTLSPEVGLAESFILKSNGGNQLLIDTLNIPLLSLSTKTKLITFKSGFSFDLNLSSGIMLATKHKGVETDSGFFYNFGIGSSYDFGNNLLYINTSIANNKFKNGVGEQTSKDLALNIGFGWNF